MSVEWTSHSHPEGQLYFQRRFPKFGVVTEANVHREETEEEVLGWLKCIDDFISQQDIAMPPLSELFIELDESESTCSYYFVNHDTRRLFWLEQISTELLDMGMVVSNTHIGTHTNTSTARTCPHNSADMALERLYWVHVEFFPMHICAQVPSQVVDDLIGVMSHGAAGICLLLRYFHYSDLFE
jgi:hypothetical protein